MKKILLLFLAGFLFTGCFKKTAKIGDKAHGGIIAYIDDTGEHGI